MQLGICTSTESAAAMKPQGWHYVEENCQNLLKGLVPDTEWAELPRARACALPVKATNVLLPGTLPVTGPDVDLGKVESYIATVLKRAATVGVSAMVFGSGKARQVPEGFDRETARKQIIAFLKMMAPIAAANKVTMVIEPLNRKECNILNSVGESMTYVHEVNHPNIQCLVDSYHFWLENEPLENLRAAMPWIKHVHVADVEGRVAPGLSGKADYRPFFAELKRGGYDGRISVESSKFDIATVGPQIIHYLKDQWAAA